MPRPIWKDSGGSPQREAKARPASTGKVGSTGSRAMPPSAAELARAAEAAALAAELARWELKARRVVAREAPASDHCQCSGSGWRRSGAKHGTRASFIVSSYASASASRRYRVFSTVDSPLPPGYPRCAPLRGGPGGSVSRASGGRERRVPEGAVQPEAPLRSHKPEIPSAETRARHIRFADARPSPLAPCSSAAASS